MRTALLKKRPQFVAYLRPERVNAARVFWCSLKKRAAEGRALKLSTFCFISLKQKVRTKLLARAKTTLLAATHEAGFSQYPNGHCSLPPRLRRLVHENLAVLRFSVNLRFYIFNNYSRKQNDAFALRTPICKYLCFCGKSEFAAFHNMCALKNAAKRENQPLGFMPTAGFLSNRRKSQATACRDFRELPISLPRTAAPAPLRRGG